MAALMILGGVHFRPAVTARHILVGFQPAFPLPHSPCAVDANIGRPTYMWSDLVPPKQSIGFMPHCRNTDGGRRELDETSSSIEPPTYATYIPPLYFFPSFTIRYHDKCNGGYTPNLKPMRGARRKSSVPDYRCLAGLQTNGPSFFTTMLLSLLAPGSVTCFCVFVIYIEQHSFQRIPSPHHGNSS